MFYVWICLIAKCIWMITKFLFAVGLVFYAPVFGISSGSKHEHRRVPKLSLSTFIRNHRKGN
jgi:hypothetical protein